MYDDQDDADEHIKKAGGEKGGPDYHKQLASADNTSTAVVSNQRDYDNKKKALDVKQAEVTRDSTRLENNGWKYGSDWGRALPLQSQEDRNALRRDVNKAKSKLPPK